MRAWNSPDSGTGAVPGGVRGPEVRVFDSSTQELVELVPAAGPARMYVCGITPYDATHLGHAATYVAFDLLNRAWRSAGHDVEYCQNVTDVDDPLLERAVSTGTDWVALAERETELFRADMEALRVLPPDSYVGAVESIPLVVEMVERLREEGSVYAVPSTGSGDDLYFSVSHDPTFGEVSGWTREHMLAVFAERGGDPDRPGKKDPLDCLLWQAERPGEPAWDTPLGRGRPGWHIECSAIARRHLGAAIDVQGGGSDLVFPHHEMSASEAQVADPGHRFARAYVHAGMVGLDGEKMSKSKGNLVLVSALRESGLDPMVIRLAAAAATTTAATGTGTRPMSPPPAPVSTSGAAPSARDSGAPTDRLVAERAGQPRRGPRRPDRPAPVDHWANATDFGATDEPGAGDRRPHPRRRHPRHHPLTLPPYPPRRHRLHPRHRPGVTDSPPDTAQASQIHPLTSPRRHRFTPRRRRGVTDSPPRRLGVADSFRGPESVGMAHRSYGESATPRRSVGVNLRRLGEVGIGRGWVLRRSVRGVVAALEVALELPGDGLAAGLGELGGVLALLEAADVLRDVLVLLGELGDAALPGPAVLGQVAERDRGSSRSSTWPSSARVALGHGGCGR